MANTKIFKTNKPINPKQHIWSNIDIPIGICVEQVNDTKTLLILLQELQLKLKD